jgi:polyisoprenoid-binding protein YceI
MKKKITIIGILLLIAGLVGFLVIQMMYKKAERNVATEQAVIIDATQFATLYKDAADSANKLYLNKTIQLTGIVSSVSNNQENQTDIIITVQDSLPPISCTIDGMYKSINVPDTITIKGICSGILSNINLKNCIVLASKKYTGPIDTLPKLQKPKTQIDTSKNKATKTNTPESITIFKTQKAQIIFDAGGGLEDIKATNNKVEADIDIAGNVNFILAMLEFKFADALMQQHFNEEYVESAKFPTAKFKGKIVNNNEVNINKDGTYKAAIKGQITIHGITKEIQTTALIIVKNQTIKATATLKIILADFAVKSVAADEAVLKISCNF